MNVLNFYQKKLKREKISMVTCYDYTSAKILSKTSVDCLLVGDSVAMTMHGFKDTLSATIEMMALHTAAVSRGANDKFIVSDLPFLSYRKSLSKNVSATQALMQAGAHAVKLENVSGNEKLIKHLTESGIPVMGHLGLTPQFINILGGHKVQGKNDESAARIKNDALALQDAGCFALVFECIPSLLAQEISLLGQKEAELELKSKQNIVVTCEFCSKEYIFDTVDVARIFASGDKPPSSTQIQ